MARVSSSHDGKKWFVRCALCDFSKTKRSRGLALKVALKHDVSKKHRKNMKGKK